MSTTRQSRTPKRSYVELSSDEDDAAVPQPSRGSSSRSATARRASSKGRAANGNKKEEDGHTKKRVKVHGEDGTVKKANKKTSQLQLLLTMPLDIVAEVCSHLEPETLLRLSSTSKVFRTLLLSPSNKGLWAKSRELLGLPSMTSLTEWQYANMLTSTRCQICDSSKSTLDVPLRTRACSPCFKKALVAQTQLKRTLPHLHARAMECARSSNRAYHGIVPRFNFFLVSELNAVSQTLHDLQEEDELAEFSGRKPSYGGSRSRSRGGRLATEQDAAPQLSKVEEFVQSKAVWVKTMDEESKAVKDALNKLEREKLAEKREMLRLVREAEVAKVEARKVELLAIGWTTEQADALERFSHRIKGNVIMPRNSPSESAEEWAPVLVKVQEVMDDFEARRLERLAAVVLRQHQQTCRNVIRPFFTALRDSQSTPDLKHTFPHFTTFLNLPSIVPFWQSQDSVDLDDARWALELSSVEADIASHRATKRMEVIQLILRSTSTKPDPKLSTDPSSYANETKYPPSFFSRLTSQFFRVQNRWRFSQPTRGIPNASIEVASYPSALEPISSGYPGHNFMRVDDEVKLEDCMSRRHVTVMRALIKGAGLKEATATVDDLDRVGKNWRWLEYPVNKKEATSWEWKPLMHEILRRNRSSSSVDAAGQWPVPTIVADHGDTEDEVEESEASEEEQEENQGQGDDLSSEEEGPQGEAREMDMDSDEENEEE